MKLAIVAFLLFAANAIAGPPFNYFGARSMAEERVETDIEEEQRLYILGPEVQKESYISNNNPAEREVSKPRIVSIQAAKTVQELWLIVRGDMPSEGLHLSIYRSDEPIKPVVTITGKDMEHSDFILLAKDVVFIRIPKLGFIL